MWAKVSFFSCFIKQNGMYFNTNYAHLLSKIRGRFGVKCKGANCINYQASFIYFFAFAICMAYNFKVLKWYFFKKIVLLHLTLLMLHSHRRNLTLKFTNMTTKSLLMTVAAFSLLTFFSACKKDSDSNLAAIETTFAISENQAVADVYTQDAADVSEEASARFGLYGNATICNLPLTMNWIGSCATVTVSGSFPAKNIRIDFGTGCTSPNGLVRKGIINVTLTDSVRANGSVATTTFDNYFVNGIKKEGTIIRTNTTAAGSINRSMNRTVVNGKITLPNGNVFTHNANINIVQTEGGSTPCDLRDDVYNLTGTRSATNAQGSTRVSTTQTALQKKMSCANIDKGILLVQGPNHEATINFGNGTCNNLATISINGRPERTIILR